MRKYLWLFLALFVFCAVSSGGCGGGSSDESVTQDNGNQNNNSTPQNPISTYDFSILKGSWTASDATGTATGPYGTFDLRMVHANALFTNVQANGNTATAIVSTSMEWDAYLNGQYSTTIYGNNDQETIEIRTVSENVWRYTFPDGKSTVTVRITSSTTADVTEEGTTSDGYQYTASYTVTKDGPDSPTIFYGIETYRGTWSISQGAGTASGNGRTFELRLSSGTITVSNLQGSSVNMSGDLDGVIYWNIYQDGTYLRRIGLRYRTLIAHRIGGNSWRSTSGNSNLTLTSQATASINEKGSITIDGYTYQYFIAYTMAKQ